MNGTMKALACAAIVLLAASAAGAETITEGWNDGNTNGWLAPLTTDLDSEDWQLCQLTWDPSWSAEDAIVLRGAAAPVASANWGGVKHLHR